MYILHVFIQVCTLYLLKPFMFFLLFLASAETRDTKGYRFVIQCVTVSLLVSVSPRPNSRPNRFTPDTLGPPVSTSPSLSLSPSPSLPLCPSNSPSLSLSPSLSPFFYLPPSLHLSRCKNLYNAWLLLFPCLTVGLISPERAPTCW